MCMLGGDTAQPVSFLHHIRQHNNILIISLLLVSISQHPNLHCTSQMGSPRPPLNSHPMNPTKSWHQKGLAGFEEALL